MFLPERRSVWRLRGGVTMILASTTVEPIEDVECLLLFSSRPLSFSSVTTLSSLGQPIAAAKFSIDGVTGLFVLASTLSRRPDWRRGRGLGDGEAVSSARCGCILFDGEDRGVMRFRRTVTLRIISEFHSPSETLSSPSSCAPAIASPAPPYNTPSVGVTSHSSTSNASPNPLSSSTVLNRSPNGVKLRLSLGSELSGSSRAVMNDSALLDGYVRTCGRSALRGGLGSGVGGLRAFTGVLSVDFLEEREGFSAGCMSCDMVGGVGGRPESLRGPGGSSGVAKTDSSSSPGSAAVVKCDECAVMVAPSTQPSRIWVVYSGARCPPPL